jgi:hypothetical protein
MMTTENGDSDEITLNIAAIKKNHAIRPLIAIDIAGFCNALVVLKTNPNEFLFAAAEQHSKELVLLALQHGANIKAVINGWSVMGKAGKAPLDFFRFLHSLGAMPREYWKEHNTWTISSVAISEAHNVQALLYIRSIDPYSFRPLLNGPSHSLIWNLLQKRDEHVMLTLTRIFSEERINTLYKLVYWGSNLYHPINPDAREHDLLARVLVRFQESVYYEDYKNLGRFAIYLTAYGMSTTFLDGWTLVDEHNIGTCLLASSAPNLQDTIREIFGEYKQLIKQDRIEMIDEQVCDLCFALSNQFPALILVEILDHMTWRSQFVPFHLKWQCVTLIKHFKTTQC